jgi:putative acetyltransferase
MTTPSAIRPEQPADVDGIRRVLLSAFDGDAEARLVDALRDSAGWLPGLSVVLRDDTEVLAHVLLSRILVDGAPALALGPVAVLPNDQRRGLGSAVIRDALDRATAAGETLVVLVGEPEFYARFGFVPGARYGLTGAWSQFGDAWQVLVLPGAAEPQPAEVVHPGPWHRLQTG